MIFQKKITHIHIYMQRKEEIKWMVNIYVVWVKDMQDFFVLYLKFFCKSDIKSKFKNEETSKKFHETKLSSYNKCPGSIL